ncbi:MAG: UDP-N-acetylmuramate dehydrogenase [Planctomycetota bacterium]
MGGAVTTGGLALREDERIKTWFRVGGAARRLARPASLEQLSECLSIDPAARILGDGANLLVHDGGVEELVVDLSDPAFRAVGFEGDRVVAAAGARLPVLIGRAVSLGLGGLEGLAGIPASVGGAVVMNAGGVFGEIGDVVERVHALRRDGERVTLERDQIGFGYRRSGLGGLVVTSVELRLEPGDREALRARRDECMAHKKASQPLDASSAGCCFKNPTLEADLDEIGAAGRRVSAGLLLDRAGCKRLGVGGAHVSERHANFVVTTRDARASDVIGLMEEMAGRVRDRFGVGLEREVVVWGA